VRPELTEIVSCQGKIILAITYGTIEEGGHDLLELGVRTVAILANMISGYAVDAIPLSKLF